MEFKSSHQANFINWMHRNNYDQKDILGRCPGLSQATLNRYINGKSKEPSISLVIEILKGFPELNPSWWLLNRGPMEWAKKSDLDSLNEPSPPYVLGGEPKLGDKLLKNQIAMLKKLNNIEILLQK